MVRAVVYASVLLATTSPPGGRRSLLCLVGKHSDIDVRLNAEDRSVVTQQCTRCGRLRDDELFPRFQHDQRKGDTAWLMNPGNGGPGSW
jgi:hypothetical protein